MRPPNFGSPISYFLPLPSYIGIGPCPIHEVVVTAVRKAVRAVKSTKSLCTFRSESYHLHCNLNQSILLHNSSSLISSSNRLNQVLHRHRCCHHPCCRLRCCHHSCHSCHSCSTHYHRSHRHHSPWFRCPRSHCPPPLRRRRWSRASPPYRRGRSR